MKKLLIIIVAFLAACGSQRDRSHNNQFKPYTPDHIEQIGRAVFELNGLNWNDYSIRFYVGSDENVQLACGGFDHDGAHINGCNFSDEEKIFMAEPTKDWCQILVHELTHQALYYKNGDSDENHTNEQFGVVAVSNLCLSMNLFP